MNDDRDDDEPGNILQLMLVGSDNDGYYEYDGKHGQNWKQVLERSDAAVNKRVE